MNGNSYLVWSEDKTTQSLVHMKSVFATSRSQARRLFMKYERFKFNVDDTYFPNVAVCVQDPAW